MPFLPEIILSLLANFAHAFTAPTWKYAQTLLIGAIVCNGKRTVSSALRSMGLSNEKRIERYHRVLSQARWSEFRLSKILLGLLIGLIPANMPVLIAMDETIERRSGKKITTAKGCYRDACRSSSNLVIKCFGLKWLCAALIVKFPWSNNYCALPFMTVLCPSKGRGRKRVKGNKQPILKQRLKEKPLIWHEQRVTWYGRILKHVKLAGGYKAGEKPLKIRWVMVNNVITDAKLYHST